MVSIVLWLRARQWRRSAEESIRPAHFDAERARLGEELASRAIEIMGARGVRPAADQDMSGRVAEVVAGQLDRKLLQASLGLRYLALMQDRVRWADYEDVPRLQAETAWLEGYLRLRLRSEWLRAALENSAESRLPSPEELYTPVLKRIVQQLDSAALAA